MSYLVRCSCGWSAVDAATPLATTEMVRLAVPAMVDHWERGHRVTARGGLFHVLRKAAVDWATAQGYEFDEDDVPGATPSPYRPRGRARGTVDDAFWDALRDQIHRRARRDDW